MFHCSPSVHCHVTNTTYFDSIAAMIKFFLYLCSESEQPDQELLTEIIRTSFTLNSLTLVFSNEAV